MILAANLLLVSLRQSRSLAVGRQRAMLSSVSSVMPSPSSGLLPPTRTPLGRGRLRLGQLLEAKHFLRCLRMQPGVLSLAPLHLALGLLHLSPGIERQPSGLLELPLEAGLLWSGAMEYYGSCSGRPLLPSMPPAVTTQAASPAAGAMGFGGHSSRDGFPPLEMFGPPLNFPAKFLIYPPGKAYLGGALRGTNLQRAVCFGRSMRVWFHTSRTAIPTKDGASLAARQPCIGRRPCR